MNAFRDNFLEHNELEDYEDSEMLENDFELDLELDELDLVPQELEAEEESDRRSRVPVRRPPRTRPLPARSQRHRPLPPRWQRFGPLWAAGGPPAYRPKPRRGIRRYPRWGFVDEPVSSSPEHGEEYIRWVQSALNSVLGLRLPVNGVMGPETRSAVRSFQERQGLAVTGIVGPDIESALIAARGGKSPGAEATKPAEPGMPEPAEPAATPPEPRMTEPAEPAPTSPAAEFDFEWETLDDASEDAEQEANQTIWRSKRSRDFETATPAARAPKTISRFNTDLNAPYFGGNCNFLYNGGSNEAVITYNTYLSYTKSFSKRQKRQLINNLKQAVAVWDCAAEMQVKNAAGNYNDRIRLRFKCNIVTNSKNANKRTQAHPPGSRTVFFMDKDRENVMRDLNIYIGSSRNVLVHELGHVWGLLDEYKDRWISMKLSLGHVGAGSPLIKDKISIMNEGYADETRNNGEFRTRYFEHFGRAILGAFWGLTKYTIPVRHDGKVVSNTVQGRIALLKRDIAGNPPYTADRLPFNPVFTKVVIAKRS